MWAVLAGGQAYGQAGLGWLWTKSHQSHQCTEWEQCNTVVPWVWKFVVENNLFSNTWKTKQGKGAQLPSRTPILWIDEHQRIPRQQTDSFTSTCTGISRLWASVCASRWCLWADAVYKQKNGKMRAVANGSRTLPPAEQNYNLQSGKLEFLHLKQAICEKHGYYLFYVVLQSTQTIIPSHGYCKAWCC